VLDHFDRCNFQEDGRSLVFSPVWEQQRGGKVLGTWTGPKDSPYISLWKNTCMKWKRIQHSQDDDR
jgi:hypothetical protein